jgi:hypothetical protein
VLTGLERELGFRLAKAGADASHVRSVGCRADAGDVDEQVMVACVAAVTPAGATPMPRRPKRTARRRTVAPSAGDKSTLWPGRCGRGGSALVQALGRASSGIRVRSRLQNGVICSLGGPPDARILTYALRQRDRRFVRC